MTGVNMAAQKSSRGRPEATHEAAPLDTTTTATRPTRHLAFRVNDATQARIDALIPYFSSPWHRATRSDVVRALVAEALPIVERAAKAKSAKKGGAR
jgi:hypothetical protein